MRLTLDELKVAEVAARNYPRYGWGNKTDGKGCPMYAINQFTAFDRKAWVAYESPGSPREIAVIVAAVAGDHSVRHAKDHHDYGAVISFFQGVMHGNPAYVADIFRTIIRAAEMTAAYAPPVKKLETNFLSAATTAVATASLSESSVQSPMSGLAVVQLARDNAAAARTT